MLMSEYCIPDLPLSFDLESKEVLLQLNKANRQLAELKGTALSIPNNKLLIHTLTLQEAKDSSAVENIVTTHDELFKSDKESEASWMSAATKEVFSYREAIQVGFQEVKESGLLINSCIKLIQCRLEGNYAGFRQVSGTTLQNINKEIVYTPPQNPDDVLNYMSELEKFINNDELSDLDPLIKIAIIHHQFESIHPFYDGNGRTGRILIVLYLVLKGLLDLPILYLSRYITQNKDQYYSLLQNVRDKGIALESADGRDNELEWKDWILFILRGIEETARDTTRLVKEINSLMLEFKSILRPLFGKKYKHELLNCIFFYPYTKVEHVCREMQLESRAARDYLKKIADTGLLMKKREGRTDYYINTQLMDILLRSSSSAQQVESVHEDASSLRH